MLLTRRPGTLAGSMIKVVLASHDFRRVRRRRGAPPGAPVRFVPDTGGESARRPRRSAYRRGEREDGFRCALPILLKTESNTLGRGEDAVSVATRVARDARFEGIRHQCPFLDRTLRSSTHSTGSVAETTIKASGLLELVPRRQGFGDRGERLLEGQSVLDNALGSVRFIE